MITYKTASADCLLLYAIHNESSAQRLYLFLLIPIYIFTIFFILKENKPSLHNRSWRGYANSSLKFECDWPLPLLLSLLSLEEPLPLDRREIIMLSHSTYCSFCHALSMSAHVCINLPIVLCKACKVQEPLQRQVTSNVLLHRYFHLGPWMFNWIYTSTWLQSQDCSTVSNQKKFIWVYLRKSGYKALFHLIFR